MFNMRDRVGLLPYEKQEIFGLSVNEKQDLGWEIKKLEVDKQWAKATGRGIKIAVIDTGCDINHPDIKANIIDTYNAIKKSKDVTDGNGHGSHVCGTIAASNNGIGMVGVAPNAKILPIKALADNGNGAIEHVIQGIEYAINANVDIITMSLGLSRDVKSLSRMIKKANDRNILMFCAAGNSGPSIDIMYPGRYAETISIGAIDINFNRTGFTCSGQSLDFLAPGHNIKSILPKNSYGLMSGTSMSNPFAAGCAALYLEYYKKTRPDIRIDQATMVTLLSKTALDIAEKRFQAKKYQGNGIIKPILN